MKTLSGDTAIIGGGLAGLLAAHRLGDKRKRVILVDDGLPQAKGELGGFARFSGAKFSLPPAGLGLLAVLENVDALEETLAQVVDYMGLSTRALELSDDINASGIRRLDDATFLRSYHSIVLSPREIEGLLHDLIERLPGTVTQIAGKCVDVTSDGVAWNCVVAIPSGNLRVAADTVLFAAGRTASPILIRSGAKPTAGKGIDIGLRVEFPAGRGLKELRRLGPDAKVLYNSCRTFCLNVPGRIYRYPFHNLLIPGGIVAEAGTPSSNVGILCRQPDRESWLWQLAETTGRLPHERLHKPIEVAGAALGKSLEIVTSVYGESVAACLDCFSNRLGQLGLIDWRHLHYVHLPLLDWYWDTFSKPGTFETTLRGVYAIGDSSGHARGLLQAAVSGWTVAEHLCV